MKGVGKVSEIILDECEIKKAIISYLQDSYCLWGIESYLEDFYFDIATGKISITYNKEKKMKELKK